MEDAGSEGDRVPLREGSQEESAAAPMESGSAGGAVQWLTVDGPLGVGPEEALKLARNYFYGGFCLLPWLWFVNCYYFSPVLRQRQADPLIKFYIIWSAVGCITVTALVLTWALTFAIGGEGVFGDLWKHLSVYDIADKYTMVGASSHS